MNNVEGRCRRGSGPLALLLRIRPENLQAPTGDAEKKVGRIPEGVVDGPHKSAIVDLSDKPGEHLDDDILACHDGERAGGIANLLDFVLLASDLIQETNEGVRLSFVPCLDQEPVSILRGTERD